MASKIYDFRKPLKDLDGTILKDDGKEVNLDKFLANTIKNSAIGEDIVLKLFGYAVDLTETGKIALDDEDKEKLKKYILSHPGITALGKGRLCAVLNEPSEKVK